MNQLAIKPFIGIAAIFIVSTASAVDYTTGFTLNTQASHNDNIRLLQHDKTAANKYDLSPKLILGLNTETDNLELDSSFDFNRYNRSEFNSNDRALSLVFNHQFENSSAGLNASYIHNSTLTSELLTSGQIGVKADRAEQYTVSPNWSYTINERNLIRFNVSYSEQTYGNIVYTGYKSKTAELDWFYLINERLKLIVAPNYSSYQFDDTLHSVFIGFQTSSTKTQTKDFELGAEYQISETSVLNGRFGRSQNDTITSVKDTDNVCAFGDLALIFGATCTPTPHSVKLGTTAQLSWTWQGERQQLQLSSFKQTQPTSNGYTVDALQVASSWSYQLTELDKISADLSAVRNRSIDQTDPRLDVSIADRDYGSLTLQYQHQLTERWFFNTSFQFSEQKYKQIDYHASSRVISLGILYQPTQWHWSR